MALVSSEEPPVDVIEVSQVARLLRLVLGIEGEEEVIQELVNIGAVQLRVGLDCAGELAFFEYAGVFCEVAEQQSGEKDVQGVTAGLSGVEIPVDPYPSD